MAVKEVYCAGTYRGRPCRRFLGKFLSAQGAIKCPQCGCMNRIDFDGGLAKAVKRGRMVL